MSEEGNHESQEENKNLIDNSSGQWIPRDRLDQVLGQNHVLRSENDQLKSQPVKQETLPSYSALVDQVAGGEITQAEADEVNAIRIKNDIVSEVTQTVKQAKDEDKFQAILTDYVDLVPEIEVPDSDINKRVVQEYQGLLGLGHAEDVRTQVTAVRSVLGTPELLRKQVQGKKILETHEETGSPPGGEDNRSDWDKLPARNKAFYENAIRQGAYPNQEACIEEAKSSGLLT